MIDTQRYTVRLYTSSGGVKMIRRHTGAIERQYRLNIGKLPVAYRCGALRWQRRQNTLFPASCRPVGAAMVRGEATVPGQQGVHLRLSQMSTLATPS